MYRIVILFKPGTLLSKQFNSAPKQYCSAPLLKLERSVSDRILKRSESSLNTFIGAEIGTESYIGIFKSEGSIANCMTDRASVHTGNASELFLCAPQQNI